MARPVSSRFEWFSRSGCRAAALFLAITCAALPARAAYDNDPGPPTVPKNVQGKDAVKTYLVTVVTSSLAASNALKQDGTEYAALVAAHNNDPAAAAKAEPEKMAALIHRMRNHYKIIDSFGYEYVEGIVAGVPSLMHYDVELDSGVPEKGASIQDQVADIHIKAGDTTIDKEGSLNNFLIEPTVFGTNPKFVAATATLPGYDKPVGLPKPALVIALADYSIGGYTRLLNDSKAWNPTDRDLFQAMVNMTPTLADYFDDWKESKKYGYASGGRFVAVSRVSDMRGIMSSTQLPWLSVREQVKAKDAPLAEKITTGYERVMNFIDTIDAREHQKPLGIEAIDALGSQAKEKADKLTVQVAQAAAELNIEVNGK